MENLSLGQKQRKFTQMVGQLITWVYQQPGYALTFGDAMATTGHMPNSLHYIRLAADLNLFIDNVYQTTTDAYTKMGEYWESLGGTWGGRFKDGNHFSYAHDGRK